MPRDSEGDGDVMSYIRCLVLCIVVTLAPTVAVAEGLLRTEPKPLSALPDRLTDAAVVALIIAGSIAAYKALGKPCACPDDTMSNGRRCGGNSAYVRGGGAKPLCFATDVSPAMISAYRASKAIPPLF